MSVQADYAKDMAAIDERVNSLFAMVAGAVSSAVKSAIEDDADGAAMVVERDQLIDALYREVEALGQRQLSLHAPVAQDMRYLLAVLRIVPELERSGDLAEHIASRAARGTFTDLPDRVGSLVARMGSVVSSMWHILEAAYPHRDAGAAARLRRLDNDVDELHVALIAEIVDSAVSTPLAIQLALVGRFLERLGDHAVKIGTRFGGLVAGVPKSAD